MASLRDWEKAYLRCRLDGYAWCKTVQPAGSWECLICHARIPTTSHAHVHGHAHIMEFELVDPDDVAAFRALSELAGSDEACRQWMKRDA